MRTFLWALAGFLLGALAAGTIGFSLPALMPISQAEGAYAMQVAFFWVPVGAVMGAVGGVIAGKMRN